MSGVITVDVSEFQRPVTDSYPHDWFSFRVCDGTYVDRNAAKNLAWARKAAKAGKIAGYTCYCVYRPNTPTLQTVMRVIGQPDDHVTVMVDVESWGGAIRGDHSQAITALANGLGEWLGDRRRVLAYGNHGDLVSLYPTRPSWLRFIVAGYGTQQPAFPNMIGWQYSDGDSRWPTPNGLPRKTRPFGNCDHNVFPSLTAAELAEQLGVGADMPLTDAEIQKIANAVWAHQLTHADSKTTASTGAWLVYGNRFAHAAAQVKNVTVQVKADADAIAAQIKARLIQIIGGS
jgi:hypothetical protein